MNQTPHPAAHPTQTELIRAAIALFGTAGFGATSTRAIAARAGTNISSISYHFGGKDGLRLACADALVAGIGQVARILPEDPSQLDRAAARVALHRLVRRLVSLLVAPASADVVAFMLRELAEPGSPVLDRLYDRLIEPRHRALCGLWAAATGADCDAEMTRLTVFALIGQAAYFRLAAPVVQRRMGWSGYARPQARAMARLLALNLDAMLETGDG